MRQKVKATSDSKSLQKPLMAISKQEIAIQCNISGSVIAGVTDSESGLTSYLKDRYE